MYSGEYNIQNIKNTHKKYQEKYNWQLIVCKFKTIIAELHIYLKTVEIFSRNIYLLIIKLLYFYFCVLFWLSQQP
jgi:hypothetical protein